MYLPTYVSIYLCIYPCIEALLDWSSSHPEVAVSHSISSLPCSASIVLILENGRDPKKPRCADCKMRCLDASISCDLCWACLPQRTNTTPVRLRLKALMAASVKVWRKAGRLFVYSFVHPSIHPLTHLPPPFLVRIRLPGPHAQHGV